MDTWTLQTGYPEVKVERDYENKAINFTQHRFVYSDNEKRHKFLEEKIEDPLWWIPISYTTSSKLNFNQTAPALWINKTRSLNVQSEDFQPKDWVLVNIQQTGTPCYFQNCSY